jgi:hypothetical protein
VNLRGRFRQTQALTDGDAIGHPAWGMMLAGREPNYAAEGVQAAIAPILTDVFSQPRV